MQTTVRYIQPKYMISRYKPGMTVRFDRKVLGEHTGTLVEKQGMIWLIRLPSGLELTFYEYEFDLEE